MTDAHVTQIDSLELAFNMGKSKGLKYVYIGNMPGAHHQQTTCPGCGELLIDRAGFASSRPAIQNSKCTKCGETIDGVDMG